MTTQYKSSINVKVPTYQLLVKELQRFCDENSAPNITVDIATLPSDNLGYGIEISLYNSTTQLSRIIYLTRRDLGVVVTPSFSGNKVPESYAWKIFGNRHREVVIQATIDSVSRSGSR